MATKKLNEVTQVTSVTTNHRVVLTDNNGNVSRITPANLQAHMLGGRDVESMDDGVFILAVSASATRIIKPSKWTTVGRTNGDLTAVGVVLVSGSKSIVVALSETSGNWSTANVVGGGTVADTTSSAILDFNGRANTIAQNAHSECSASKHCYQYSAVDSNNKGKAAGEWWLPSDGELLLLYANKEKINYALAKAGGTQLSDANYWSSTETSVSHAYYISFGAGIFARNTKTSNAYSIRPVAAL